MSEVAHDPGVVAKVYLHPPEPDKVEKLRAMPRLANRDLLRVAAWPTGTLHDGPNGPLVGILLPRVNGHREIHQLYGPVHRKLHYPKADWEFLLHVAMNCAAAFETVHAAGHVVGDVNQGGVLVSDQGTVRLIDCDSFQVRDDGRTFYCVVGVPEYTPPELQGCQSFRGVARTQSHDCFGLALLVFHLLFMGRHPFMGYRGPGDKSIDQLISEGRFAFGQLASTLQMKPPPHSPGMDTVPGEMAVLFERAFARPTATGTPRPPAAEWRTALAKAKANLRKCGTDPIHKYAAHLSTCPWCRIEEAGGPAFFVSLAATATFDDNFSLQAVWVAIRRVPQPPGPGALVVPTVWRGLEPQPLPADVRVQIHGTYLRLPDPPVLTLESVPEEPVYTPEHIPDDPVFVPAPLPSLTPYREVDAHADARLVYRLLTRNSDYQVAKWGTLITALGAVVAGYFSTEAGLGLLVICLAFAVTWMILRAPRRREYQALLARGLADSRTARARWEAHETRVRAERERVLRRNEAEKRACRAKVEELARRRAEAPQREAQRRQVWEENLRRVRAEREAVVRRNAERRAAYDSEVQEYERFTAARQRHNAAIDDARRRAAVERAARTTARDAARVRLDAVRRDWTTAADSLRSEFQVLLDRLNRCRAEYESLTLSFEREKAQLSAATRDAQLRDFLQDHLIDDASIKGIGPGRKRTLAAYGFETALDLDENALTGVPGFGPLLIGDLIAWRNWIAGRFRFDSTKAVSAVDLRTLHMKYHPRRRPLQAELRAGRERLQEITGRCERRLAEANAAAAALGRALAQAEADLTVF